MSSIQNIFNPLHDNENHILNSLYCHDNIKEHNSNLDNSNLDNNRDDNSKDDNNRDDINRDNNSKDDNSKKEIVITGQSNRYLIKKLIKPKNESVKIRKEIQKSNISQDYFQEHSQEEVIHNLYKNTDFTFSNAIRQMIEKKISSYRQQDILKKMYNDNKFISFSQVIEKLYNCNLKCFYCNKKTLLVYEIVRESSQWTLDRVDNNIGHNEDNVIIACLDCNLKRKQQNKDAFLFTKQLVITRN